LAGGRARFEACLKIDQRLAAANPDSAEAQRDLSVILSLLGEVLATQGDPAGARTRFETSLKIRQHLADANPLSAAAQRDLILTHVKLAQLPGGERHWREALRIALDLQKTGRLASSDDWMIDDLRKHVAGAEGTKP
jgi:hypothetical protein